MDSLQVRRARATSNVANLAPHRSGCEMSRSPYATTSALSVACPRCNAATGEHCQSKYVKGRVLERSHPARREAADAQRTQEVNPEVMK
jgi:hypothetical protein